MGDRTAAYRVLVGRPEGKIPLGKLRRRWEDDIIVSFQDVEWGTGLD
jgi:hypothetical protein